ncbi:hypothetical protein KAU30_01535 [Candidatus Bathyarchaeota archaeon]|nr:hypothetical protein [Candidatus Bathyarchaeota archaeon]
MLNRSLKVFLFAGGLILIGFGLFWVISLFFQRQCVENPVDVAVLIVVGIVSLVIGLREGVKP